VCTTDNPWPRRCTVAGNVAHSDLGIVLSAWQWSDEGDFDCDGDTDQVDLGILLTHWGEVCP